MKALKTTIQRRLSMYGFDSVNNGHNIYALLEFDITNIRKHLREKRRQGEGGSLFAFMIKAIASCLARHPDMNCMVNSRRTTYFDSVDVSVPIEMAREGKIENKQHLIKDVNGKMLKEIEAEIAAAKGAVDSKRGYIVSERVQKAFALMPRWMAVAIMKAIMADHGRVRDLSGTVFMTSVSMFSSIPGFIIPYIGGPKASSFAIGSAMKKPVAIGDEIQIREVLNVTAVFNHDIVDGAPAARFLDDLRRTIEGKYAEIV